MFKVSRRSSGAEGRSRSRAGASGAHWIALFATLLLVVSAVPVLAAELPAPAKETTLPPAPEDFDPSKLPSGEDITATIEEAEREEEKREVWLASPEGVREREESRFAYADLDPIAAQELLSTVFAKQLAQLNTDPARFLSDAQLLSTSEETSATVKDEGDGLVFESSLPVRVEDENGDLRKVDLSLEETNSGFETENALVEVQIPEAADQSIKVGEDGVAIKLVGADGERIAQPFGDENTLTVEVLPDTDMLVSPIATGVEIFNLLRSENSPETLRFQVDVPAGAELRADGEWGAEVVKSGELLTTIPEPIAVDAQGTDVPVDLQVEDDSLILTVDHREGDYAMPILLDPQVLENNENWIYGQNHNALDMGVWAYNNNGSWWFHGSTYCIYECFGPGGSGTRGLYVSLEGQRSYGADQFGQWSYSAPNSDSYISSVTLGAPYVHADHNCNEQQYPRPYNYFGVWSAGSNSWAYVSVNSANQPGGTYTLPTTGDAVIFGLSTGSGISWMPCWRDLYAGGAHIWLDDRSQPVLTTSSSGQWMDASPVRLNVKASDPGLGVKKFAAEAVNKWGVVQGWETWNSCAGTRRFPCPGTWNLAESSQPQLNYDPSALPEGIVNLSVTAFDATLRKSATTNGMTVRIDHDLPTIKLSGTITEQATLGTERPIYTIRVDATDGIPGDPNPANARSGVVSIQEWIDGNKTNEYAPGCPVQSCSRFDESVIEAAAYSKGKHTLTVKVTDAVGHVASQQLEFSLGDTQAPTLNVTGLPAESSATPLWPIHSTSFGTEGTANGQLKSPGDVAIDSAGNLWVVDKSNNRVQKFDPAGKYLAKFGTYGGSNGQFNRPTAIAIAANGDLLVADSGNNRVQRFNSSGTYLSKFGSKGTGNGQFGGSGPEGIAIDATGNIWVADTYGGRVLKFNSSGSFLKAVGSKGTGSGQLDEPSGIDIDLYGNLWVAEWGNNRLSVFDNSGSFLSHVGSAGEGDGEFNHPDTVTVDAHANVWVGDQDNDRIQRFDLAGQYQDQFGSSGSGNGQFNFSYPMGIATDSKGHLWVTDVDNHRIQEWMVPIPRPIYARSFGTEGSGDGQLKHPGDVAVDALGNLWVIDKSNNRVQKFDSSGKYLAKFSYGALNTQLNRPTAIAIAANGDLLVADSGANRVQRFSSAGVYLSHFGSKGTGNGQFGGSGPEGIAVDAASNIFVSDTYGGRIQKFDDQGQFIETIGSQGTGDGDLDEPSGIDVDLDGNLWVAEWGNNRLSVFDSDGTFLSHVGSAGSGDGEFNHPDTVTVDAQANVWVGDQDNNRIQRFDIAGQYLGQFGAQGSGAGQFELSYPMGIAADAKGHLWVTDVDNHRVQEWLVPNTTVSSGHLGPLNISATDGGYGMGSITVKLTNQSGETETLGHASQSCNEGACSLDYELDPDLSEKPRGTYLLSVVATDGAGNVKEFSRFLNLDSTPPELDLSGPLAEGAGQPLSAPSAELEIDASDPGPVSGGVSQVNVERDGQLVASYPSDCSSDCREVDPSYTFQTAADGADRSIKPVSTVGNGSIGELRRVSCVAYDNCWAVGRTKYTLAEETEGKVAEQLLERWNGSEWQTTTIPKPEGATSVTLEDISCASTSACLAVGSYGNGTSHPFTVVWDGTKWTARLLSPASGSLSTVSCGSAGDCWAYGKTEAAAPFFAHWNGSEWQTTTIPKPEGATSVTLEDISCASTSVCLAVGSYSNGTNQLLTEFWDGTKWTAGTGPLPAGATKGLLKGASCGSEGDCWAYGETQVSSAEMQEGQVAVPFFSHWDGSEWLTEAIGKAPEGGPATVNSLSCASAAACTAVGRYTNPHGETLPLAFTWDIDGWRFQPMPIKTGADYSSLEGVSCTAANECVSVGQSRLGNGQWQVLAEMEDPDGGPHEITVEAIDVQGNTASETIEIDVDPTTAAAPECNTEPELEAAQGTVTSSQAIDTIEEALPAAVAPTEGAITPSTEEEIDPSYSPPSPNLETVNSPATGETSVAPEGGFTLGDSVCIAPATLTPAATDATVVGGDAALFANTAAETDTVIRPTAMGATVIHSLRGPNAPDRFAWNVTVSPGQDLVELPSGGVAIVEVGSEAEGVAQVPSVPEKSPADLADVKVQVENGEYQLINAADETELEIVAVIARPWVVLAQGGIVPALIEVAPDTETPNEFEVWISLSITPEQEAVWPVQLIADMAGASSLNGSCGVNESPCGALDLDRMAQYAVYWGNEAHHGARNPFYVDYKSNNCTNFISQILRAGGAKFMRAFAQEDGSWWYLNLSSGGIFGTGPSAGMEDTDSWRFADVLPRHLWRFGLAHIDPMQQPWGWTKGSILAYDWIDSDGKGNVNHLNFVVGTQDMASGREPMIANSSSQGANYSNLLWGDVKRRIEQAHGSQWTRFSLAAKHRAANLKAKKHDPSNLYGSNGLFRG